MGSVYCAKLCLSLIYHHEHRERDCDGDKTSAISPLARIEYRYSSLGPCGSIEASDAAASCTSCEDRDPDRAPSLRRDSTDASTRDGIACTVRLRPPFGEFRYGNDTAPTMTQDGRVRFGPAIGDRAVVEHTTSNARMALMPITATKRIAASKHGCPVGDRSRGRPPALRVFQCPSLSAWPIMANRSLVRPDTFLHLPGFPPLAHFSPAA